MGVLILLPAFLGGLQFEREGWLFGGLAALALVVAALVVESRSGRRIAEHVHARRLATFAPWRSSARRKGRAVAAGAAVLFGSLALAGPQLGVIERPAVQRGIDLIVCLDTSRSMLARDLKPSRFERAKREVRGLLSGIGGDRVALIAFAGDARIVAPLTADMGVLASLVQSLDLRENLVGGTDLSVAIDAALDLFDGRTGASEAIVLVTDGEDLSEQGLAAAERAAEQGIAVFVVGIGTRAGGKIPVLEADGSEGFLVDEEGTEVVTRLEDESLVALAAASGGGYASTESSPNPLESLYGGGIAKLDARDIRGGVERVPADRFQWPLVLALLCIAFELGLREHRRPGAARGAGSVPRPDRKASPAPFQREGGLASERIMGSTPEASALGASRSGASSGAPSANGAALAPSGAESAGAALGAVPLLVVAVGLAVLQGVPAGTGADLAGVDAAAAPQVATDLDGALSGAEPASSEGVLVAVVPPDVSSDPQLALTLVFELLGEGRDADAIEAVELALTGAGAGAGARASRDRAVLHFALGALLSRATVEAAVVGGVAPEDIEESEQRALEALQQARLLAGPGELRLAALYDAGTLQLYSAEREFRAVVDADLLAQSAGPQMPGAGAPAPDELPDLEALAERFRVARGPLVEHLRTGSAPKDVRANLEWIQRRLRDLERMAEEQEQQQQENEEPQEGEDEEQDPGPDEQESGEDSQQDESGEQEPSDQEGEQGEQPEDPSQPGEEEAPEPQESEGADEAAEDGPEEGPEEGASEQEGEAQAASEVPALSDEEIQQLLQRLQQIEAQVEERRRAVLEQSSKRGVLRDW